MGGRALPGLRGPSGGAGDRRVAVPGLGKLGHELPQVPKHRGWIDLHRGDAFRSFVQFLIDELNRIAPQYGDDAAAHLKARERAFFDAAYPG